MALTSATSNQDRDGPPLVQHACSETTGNHLATLPSVTLGSSPTRVHAEGGSGAVSRKDRSGVKRSLASPMSFSGSTSRVVNGMHRLLSPPELLRQPGGWRTFARGAWVTLGWFWVGFILIYVWLFVLMWYLLIACTWPLLFITGVHRVRRRRRLRGQTVQEAQLATLRSIDQSLKDQARERGGY